MLKQYYELAKPGIVYGNLLTTIAAYLYASRWQIDWIPFLAALVGLGLVIASACVFNNYFDRDIDEKMMRTKERALAAGTISTEAAIILACVLGIIGFALLFLLTNILTGIVALIGFLVYVFAYTFSKRVTWWATIIGSVAGAAPIVVGYTAVVDRFDWVAFMLFLILALWQMPHFYSIAMFRSRDYLTASIPTLPLTRGTYETKLQILGFIFAFALAVFALNWFGYAGFVFLVIVEAATLVWFWRAGRGFDTDDEEAWARDLFFASLAVLVVFSVMLAVAQMLP